MTGPPPAHRPELGDCLLWTGSKFTKRGGYGAFYDDDQKLKRAHRVAWELATGTTLCSEDHVLHECDVPACVRFTHLRLGDQAENMRDMNRKGRGISQKRAVLTAELVLAARQRYAAGEPLADIVADIGFPHALTAAVHGTNWKHVPMPDYSGRLGSGRQRRGTASASSRPSPTHCPSGHPFDENNTGYRRTNKGGQKRPYCRKCNRDRVRELVIRKRVAEGRAPGTPNREKTHCPSGHPYTPDNTRVKKTGWRDCKTCHRDSQRERVRRQKQSAG